MRVGFPGGPRLEWYDRNPSGQVAQYSGSAIGPHSATVRASYTAPTGKKVMVMLVFGEVFRSAAATTLGKARIAFTIGGASTLEISHQDNTVGSIQRFGSGMTLILLAGQAVQISTQDLSTAGTLDYRTQVQMIEFSA